MIDLKKLKEEFEQDALFASLDGGFSDTYLNGALKTLEKIEAATPRIIHYTPSESGELVKKYLT